MTDRDDTDAGRSRSLSSLDNFQTDNPIPIDGVDLSKCTVKVLKQYLQSRGLTITGFLTT